MEAVSGAFASGFLLGLGLIVAIGAQNAHVLRMGLRRERVFVTVLVCTLCDVTLILLGIAGMGALISDRPRVLEAVTVGGAIFLMVYGARAFWSAYRGGEALIEAGDADAMLVEAGAEPGSHASLNRSIRAAAGIALGLSLLNPHVYLDTVVLLGGVGGRLPEAERLRFGMGAVSASTLWFFGLGYGSAWLAPLFRRALAWRIMDLLVGIVMFGLAFALLRG